MITEILFLLILIGVNAFFAASEIALISLNDIKIKLLAEEGNPKAKQLMKLLGEPSRFLATIQIGITLAGFLASAFAAETFATPLVDILKGYNLPISEPILKVTTIVIITIILAYFTLVLGELVPKRIAMKKSESIAFFVARPLAFLLKIASPFVKLLTSSTNFFVKLFGIDPHALDDHVTEEEIRMMIDVGEEEGTIHEREKVMINNIFEFNDKTVEDIMAHRVEVTGIPLSIELKNLINILKEKQYSRYPIYKGNIDNIIGILHVKDLIPLITESVIEDFNLQDYIRKPFFVPMQRKTDETLVDLQLAKTHIAIVVDDYGGTAGIITMEDLIEEIVGNIFDEYDKEDDMELKQIDETTYEVSGMISLDELEQPFDIELPVDEYETLNGFLISLFGNIPPKGQVSQVEFEHLRIQAVEVTEKRIEKAIIYFDKELE